MPIFLTSVCCKIMEHIMHRQIMQHLEEHCILSHAQHGFRKRLSCETQLLLTLRDSSAVLDNSEQIDAILLEFRTAFGYVPYEHLGVKQCLYGIRGNILAWIRSFRAQPQPASPCLGSTVQPQSHP